MWKRWRWCGKRRHEVKVFPWFLQCLSLKQESPGRIITVDFAQSGLSTQNQHLLAEFAEANKFNEQDLEQNRAERISGKQFAKLIVQAFRPVITSGITLIVWLAVSLLIREFVPYIVRLLMSKYLLAGYGAITFGAVLNFIIGLGTSANLILLVAMDLMTGKSAMIEGRATSSWESRPTQGLSRIWGGTEAVYNYCVKGEYFEVSQPGYDVLHNKKDTYSMQMKFYYSSKSKLLLSLEPK